MPIHDWTRVRPGDFHDFHQVWTGEIRTPLNLGILPDGYFAQVEQAAGAYVPDVLTLHEDESGSSGPPNVNGALAIATAPPQVMITAELERKVYDSKKNQVSIYHSSSDRIVAIIKLVSSGNKSGVRDFQKFIDKAIDSIEQGIHLLIIDLYPPTSRDPEGIHDVIWTELGGDPYTAPRNKPLTQVAYLSGEVPRCFVEPMAIGDELTAMPLFLNEDQYVPVPLAETYAAAFRGVPAHLRRMLQQSIPNT